MFKKQAVAALFALTVSSASVAAPFYLDTGAFQTGYSPDGDNRTADIAELGQTGTRSTSIYNGIPGPGVAVTDTNINSNIAPYIGTHTSLNGVTNVTIQPTVSPGANNVDNLNLVNPALIGSNHFEGFTGADYGDAGRWGLIFDYSVSGTLTANGATYNSGGFDIFLTFDGSTKVAQVLRLNVIGSAINVANLDIFGEVSFDFDGDGDDDAGAIAKTLFNDSTRNTSFYDLWAGGIGVDPLVVSWSLDTNVNPPIPTPGQLYCVDSNNDGIPECVRQTTGDSSLVFSVPVPAPLALMGVGLVALGWTARRKQA